MRRLLITALLLVVVLSGLIIVWKQSSIGFGGSAEMVPEDERRPAGSWNFGAPLSQDPDELARLLALPYAAGEKLATAPGLGVVINQPERTQPGLNFYVSGHAAEAILTDMEGTFLHRWLGNYRQTFPEDPTRTGAGRHNLRRAALLPNGDIIALWHAGGIARLDLRSRVVWAVDMGFYNDLFYERTQSGQETLIALHKLAEERPALGSEPVLNDQLLWLDPNSGEVLRRVSLLDAVIDSTWAPLLTEEHPDPADLLHANTITVLDEAAVAGSPFQPGWILVSLREISLVAVVDPEAKGGAGAIVWGLHGPFVRQHEPVLLPGGPDSEAQLLVFDNQGLAKERARVLRLSLEGDIHWQYPDPDKAGSSPSLSSHEVGVVRPLENGNLLIIESLGGRAIELAPDGANGWEEVLWQFETPHRTGPSGSLIATLMDLERVPVPGWLSEAVPTSSPSR